MATEALEIQVGADLAQAQAAFKKLEADIKKAMKGGEKSFQDFVRSYQQGAAGIGAASNRAGEAVGKSTKNYTNLSRVLQDLPFGLVGVQNNLTQLVPAAGVAGLAFSAFISALTFAQTGLNNWIRGNKGGASSVEDHLEKIQNIRKALDNYVESLDDINRARIQGSQSAQDELVKLETLYKATQNANVPLAERKKLVDELQNEYPKYFQNISDETILAGGAASAYKQLANSILAAARARAAQDEIVDIEKQVLALESKQAKALQEEFDLYTKLNKATAKRNQQTFSRDASDTDAGRTQAALQYEYNEALENTTGIFKQIIELQKRSKNLAEDVTKNIVTNGADVLIKPSAKVKVKKEVDEIFKDLPPFKVDVIPNTGNLNQSIDKSGLENIKPIPIDLIPRFDIRKALQNIQMAEGGIFVDFGRNLGNRLGAGFGEVFEKIFEGKLKSAISKGLAGKELEAFKERFAALASIGVQFLDGIASSFSAMSEALINGQNILAAFGNSIKRVVSDIVAAITKAAVLGGILSLLTGGASKGGLSFGGAFFKILKGITGFAEGGIVTGATLGLIGEGTGTSKSNPEVIAPLDKLKGMLGGMGGSTNISGEFRVRGKDLVYVLAQENKSQGRRF